MAATLLKGHSSAEAWPANGCWVTPLYFQLKVFRWKRMWEHVVKLYPVLTFYDSNAAACLKGWRTRLVNPRWNPWHLHPKVLRWKGLWKPWWHSGMVWALVRAHWTDLNGLMFGFSSFRSWIGLSLIGTWMGDPLGILCTCVVHDGTKVAYKDFESTYLAEREKGCRISWPCSLIKQGSS